MNDLAKSSRSDFIKESCDDKKATVDNASSLSSARPWKMNDNEDKKLCQWNYSANNP